VIVLFHCTKSTLKNLYLASNPDIEIRTSRPVPLIKMPLVPIFASVDQCARSTPAFSANASLPELYCTSVAGPAYPRRARTSGTTLDQRAHLHFGRSPCPLHASAFGQRSIARASLHLGDLSSLASAGPHLGHHHSTPRSPYGPA
jgi:hypothetical protein